MPPRPPVRPGPGSFEEQATTIIPAYPSIAEEQATSASNRRLIWLLAGSVAVVAVLLFAVLSGQDETPPLVSTVPVNADIPPTSAPPTSTPPTSTPPTSSVPTSTLPTSTSPTTLPPLTTEQKPKPTIRRTVRPKPTRQAPRKPEPTTQRAPKPTTEREPDSTTDPYSDPTTRHDPYGDDSTERNDPYSDGADSGGRTNSYDRDPDADSGGY